MAKTNGNSTAGPKGCSGSGQSSKGILPKKPVKKKQKPTTQGG